MHSRPKRKRRLEKNVADLTLREQVCEELRKIQWKTNCSTQTLQCFLDALRGKLGRLTRECADLPRSAEYADTKMQSMVNMCYVY